MAICLLVYHLSHKKATCLTSIHQVRDPSLRNVRAPVVDQLRGHRRVLEVDGGDVCLVELLGDGCEHLARVSIVLYVDLAAQVQDVLG